MEKIIKKALMQFLKQHRLLPNGQQGFRSGTSCLTNVLFSLERWTKARDEGNVVHAIYIDFKKAFGSAPHQRLLHKLRNAGIRGRLLTAMLTLLIMAACNGRWLLDHPEANSPEIRSVLVARELSRHIVDMAAPSETRLSEMTQHEEVNFG
nr:unnamed protein product [Spirometra erinaceieuropaei]